MRSISFLLLAGFIIFHCCCAAFFSVQASQMVKGINPSTPFSHNLWDATLADAVNPQGWIDFSHLKANPRQLNGYLQLLEQVSPENHPELFESPEAVLAYWVNAYNALLLRFTLDVYPIETAQPVMKRLPLLLGHYWLGGYPTTLDEVAKKATQLGQSLGISVAPLLASLTLAGPVLHNQAYSGLNIAQQAGNQANILTPYVFLRQQTALACRQWVLQYLDRKKGTLLHYKTTSRLPFEFPLPVPRPMLPTTLPYSAKPLYHYCLAPQEEAPPPPNLLMDVWQLVP